MSHPEQYSTSEPGEGSPSEASTGSAGDVGATAQETSRGSADDVGTSAPGASTGSAVAADAAGGDGSATQFPAYRPAPGAYQHSQQYQQSPYSYQPGQGRPGQQSPYAPHPTSQVPGQPIAPGSGHPQAAQSNGAGWGMLWISIAAVFVALGVIPQTSIASYFLFSNMFFLDSQVFTAVSLALQIAAAVTAGALLRRTSLRAVLITGLAALALGTLLALIPLAPIFAAGTLLQAIASGTLMTVMLAAILRLAPPRFRGLWLAVFPLVLILAPTVASAAANSIAVPFGMVVAVGGFIVPIGVLLVLAIALKSREAASSPQRPVDALSVAALAVGLAIFGIGLMLVWRIRSSTLLSIPVSVAGAVLVVLGLAVLAGFVWRQVALQRSDRALLDLRLFTLPNFGIGIGLILLVSALWTFNGSFMFSLLVSSIGGEFALMGLVSALDVIPFVLVGVLAAFLAGRYGARPLLIAGGAAMLLALLGIFVGGQELGLAFAILIRTLFSIGLAACVVPALFTVFRGVSPQHTPHAAAATAGAWTLAGLLYFGITNIAQIVAIGGAPSSDTGYIYNDAIVIVALLLAAGVLACAFFVREPRREGPAPAAYSDASPPDCR